ncbi:MAG: peptidoglycan synthetase [Bacteroidetes bacterium]|nr:peptidoglycan synthetase [Bacteroidota bacterium]MCB0844112.1 peptidoglycan synthetase [Bacteroidota bacterium]
MRIHFIAVGGSIMHSLAIALHQAGHQVTGSDDQIYDPARTKLDKAGLLPDKDGWDAERITEDIDVIVLGMHAFEDNPELIRATILGLNIVSFPEFIFQQSQNKHRIVIAGSYGKTTITSMIMHVLKSEGRNFNYLVGANVPGFENSVKLDEDAPTLIVEGDEYLSSRMDRRPKFLLYQPHMVVISGISWDHINVFPTEDEYVDQFAFLLKSLEKAAVVIYNENDQRLTNLAKKYVDEDRQYLHPFGIPSYKVKGGQYEIKIKGEKQKLQVIGKHNMANIAAAWEVCDLLGIEVVDFLKHMATFTGAKSRMETVSETENKLVIKDYAHAPAKVQATVEAVRERYKKRNLIACVELHTFSSLNKEFIPLYKNTLKKADYKIIFIDPHALQKRRMPAISREDLVKAFGDKSLIYLTESSSIEDTIRKCQTGDDVILMMSSGNFDGLNLKNL